MENAIQQALSRFAAGGVLNHAYVLVAPQERLKEVSSSVYRAILCENHHGQDDCRSCQALTAKTHPDAVLVDTLPRENITIEMVQAAQKRAALKPQVAAHLVVTIPFAHHLTPSAANALLKSMEEPAEHAIFMLGTPNERLLLPTITSRAHILTLRTQRIQGIDEEWSAFLEGTPAVRAQQAATRFPKNMDHQELKNELHRGMVAMQEKLRQRMHSAQTHQQREHVTHQLKRLRVLQQQLDANANKKMVLESLITSL